MRKRMKPDIYMPLIIGDWLKDTGHLDATCQGAYFLLILHHWGKPGVPADPESLMNMTKVRPTDWARVHGLIRPFFTEEGGMWIHGNCVELYQSTATAYNARVNGGKEGADRRWKDRIPNNPPMGNDKQPIATEKGSHSDTQYYTESESESDSPKGEGEPPAHAPEKKAFKKPTLEECREHAILSGLPDSEAERFWNYYESNGWRVGRNPMKSWVSAMANWKKGWQEKGVPASSVTAPTIFGLKTVLETKQSLLKQIWDSHASECAGGSVNWDRPENREKYTKLRGEIKKVQQQLSTMA